MNVLLLRSGGLGDALLTLPVAQAIRDARPQASIDILGNESMLAAARLTTLFHEFHSLDHARFAALYGDSPATCGRFFARYDLVYAFTAADVGRFKAQVLADGAGDCQARDPRPPEGYARHITAHLLSVLDELPAEPPMPQLHTENHISGNGIVIHPGSGGVGKNWPVERFIELAERFTPPVTFLLGPAELERGMAARLPGRIVTELPLDAVRDLLADAAFYIGNDSGVSHLAGMLGTPSLVLFGPSDPVVWRPLGPQVRVLRAPGGSMERLEVGEVYEAVDCRL